MTLEHITADLSDRLRRRDVTFRPADLKAFVTDVQPQQVSEADMEELVERFIAAHYEYAHQTREALYARHQLRASLLRAAWLGIAAAVMAYYSPTWYDDLRSGQIGWYILPVVFAGGFVYYIVRAVRAWLVLARAKPFKTPPRQ